MKEDAPQQEIDYPIKLKWLLYCPEGHQNPSVPILSYKRRYHLCCLLFNIL